MFYEPGVTDHGLAKPPFKSCVVPRPIGWLSTLAADGTPNLAPYSQFTNLSFDPPFVLVSINEGRRMKRKDTVINIEETGEFVYNMATYDLREQVNISAGEFAPEVDEFERAGLTKAPSEIVKPFRVAESPIQFECKYHQTIHLPGDGKKGCCDIIIGRVVGIHIKDEFIMPDGKLDILAMKPLARLGYLDYTTIDRIFEIKPYLDDGLEEDVPFGLAGGASK